MLGAVRKALKVLGLDCFSVDGINVTKALFFGGTELTASVAELNKLDGVTALPADLSLVAGMAAAGAKLPRTAVVDLAALDTAGGVLAWTPGVACIVTGVIVDVTTKSTAACTLDIGYAANGTTSANSLMDGVDVGTAIGTFNNVDNKGSEGLGSHSTKMTAAQYITASKASGAAAGLAGKAYITYIPV